MNKPESVKIANSVHRLIRPACWQRPSWLISGFPHAKSAAAAQRRTWCISKKKLSFTISRRFALTHIALARSLALHSSRSEFKMGGHVWGGRVRRTRQTRMTSRWGSGARRVAIFLFPPWTDILLDWTLMVTASPCVTSGPVNSVSLETRKDVRGTITHKPGAFLPQTGRIICRSKTSSMMIMIMMMPSERWSCRFAWLYTIHGPRSILSPWRTHWCGKRRSSSRALSVEKMADISSFPREFLFSTLFRTRKNCKRRKTHPGICHGMRNTFSSR